MFLCHNIVLFCQHGVFAFFEKVHRDVLEGLALIVRNGACYGIGRRESTECQKARRCQKIGCFDRHVYSFFQKLLKTHSITNNLNHDWHNVT